MRVRPAAERDRVVALAQHAAAAATRARPHRGVPTRLSPPRTTSAGKPFWCARSAYDRQYSSGCFDVRNGTMRSRGTSLPRLVTRCRRLSSSSAPTALSVRNTNVPCSRQPPHRVVGVDPRVHALGAASSARGGRSSAANTDGPMREPTRRSIRVPYYNPRRDLRPTCAPPCRAFPRCRSSRRRRRSNRCRACRRCSAAARGSSSSATMRFRSGSAATRCASSRFVAARAVRTAPTR